MLLIWPVYLENYLKSKLNVSCTFLNLPDEQKQGKIDLNSYIENERFAKHMDNLLDNIEFKIICLSCTTSYYYLSTKMIAEYFQKNFPESILVAGGAHVTARPDDFSYKNSPIDFLIIGEGERALYEIIRDSYNKQNFPKKIFGNPIENLDDLPRLDLSILNDYTDDVDSPEEYDQFFDTLKEMALEDDKENT